MIPVSPTSRMTPAVRLRRILGSGVIAWVLLLGLVIGWGGSRRGVEGGGVYELSELPPIGDDSKSSEADLLGKLMLASQSRNLSNSSIRIGTFNIHSGKGRDEVFDLKRTANTIPRHLDIVFLQEVRSGLWGFSPDQAASLAQQLYMRNVFLPVEAQWFQPHFGNALLSRRNHDVIASLPLPCTQGKKYRGAMLTRFVVDNSSINLMGAHIDLRVDHDRQLEMVLSVFESLASPKVLIGDLNTTPDQTAMISFLAKTGCRNVFASEGHGRDWMIIDGLRVRESGIIDHGGSDHGLLWAELAVVNVPNKVASEEPSVLK